MSNSSRKFSKFALNSYATVEQIDEVLKERQSELKAYAYCYHDRDVKEDGSRKEPHTHIVLWTQESKTEIAVINWFKGCTDYKGERANILCEVQRKCIHNDGTEEYLDVDLCGITCYLAHEDKYGNALENKYHYGFEEVKGWNVALLKNWQANSGRKPREDKSWEILERLMNGESPRTLAKEYGRDFILNYHKYVELSRAIYFEEEYDKEQKDSIQWLNDQHEIATLKKENAIMKAQITSAGIVFESEVEK